MRPHWGWRALVGGVILGLPAGALFFISVPVLTVTDVKAGQELFAVQVRAGDRLALSSRHPRTRGLVSRTFEVEVDGILSAKETTPGLGGGERVPELLLLVHPFTEDTIVVKGKTVNLSEKVKPESLVRIHVERRFWWWTWPQKAEALLARIRRST